MTDEETMEEITNAATARALGIMQSMRDDRDTRAVSKIVDYVAVIALADALRHSLRGTHVLEVVMEAVNVISVSLRAGLDEREGRGGPSA